MKLQQICNALQELCPLNLAESFDNVGLLVGSYQAEINGILVALDTTPEVVDEAISNNCNCIISFHPIIFNGLTSITGKTYVEQTVIKAIQNNINIYAVHTALDNVPNGVNDVLGKQLGLTQLKALIPKSNNLQKLQFYVPTSHAQTVRDTLFKAGAGKIGNYDCCSFNVNGNGTFRALQNAKPFVGEVGKPHTEQEVMVSITYHSHLQNQIIEALQKSHPYETVAYEVYNINNQSDEIGMGRIGELNTELTEQEFLHLVKQNINTKSIRHSRFIHKKIKKVAVLGGSGAFAIPAAIKQKADAFVTADLKYHDFFTAQNQMLLCDIGHYESEQFTKNLIVNFLQEKFPNFAILNCKHNSNPVNYF